ncbi:MAG: hypothetical protein WBE11_05270 [Candidatus Aminicenantaceae bacterium]
MKKALIAAGIFSLVVFSLYHFLLFLKGRSLSHDQEIKVILVYTSNFVKDYSHIIKAYESILEEEGIPFDVLSAHLLLSLEADDVVKYHPAIIFPDGAARYLPPEFETWTKEYCAKGGNVIVAYDAGTTNVKKAFLKEAIFANITGINYITYDLIGEDAYTVGYIKFVDERCSEFFQVPFGKTAEGTLLGGYAYGKLEYPIACNTYHKAIRPDEVFATAIAKDGQEYPAIVLRECGRGKVLYVNLPLGHLKCFSDDLPLRVVLRTFLKKVIKIPYLHNTSYGKGGLVINWHIDSSIDWASIDAMLRDGYLMKDIQYSIHITASDFRDEPGDGLGFDACGKGGPFLQLIKDYGVFGSHGGWGHNWFSRNIENNTFQRKEIYDYIKKNNECLESIVDYKVVEYAAPNGTHPQPVTTEVLEELGFLAYYYTGDTGSAPNRTFFNGRKISDQIIAFPILTFGKAASFYEMQRYGYSEDEVKKWLSKITDYVIDNRTVRLIYSHPYDIPEYPDAIKSFLNYANQKQQEGSLRIDTMTSFAGFHLKFLKTDCQFKNKEKKMIISLWNPEELKGITVALPKKGYKKPSSPNLSVEEEEDYYYMTITRSIKEKVIVVERQ